MAKQYICIPLVFTAICYSFTVLIASSFGNEIHSACWIVLGWGLPDSLWASVCILPFSMLNSHRILIFYHVFKIYNLVPNSCLAKQYSF